MFGKLKFRFQDLPDTASQFPVGLHNGKVSYKFTFLKRKDASASASLRSLAISLVLFNIKIKR